MYVQTTSNLLITMFITVSFDLVELASHLF